MTCPCCGDIFYERSIKDHYGKYFKVQQCQSCGGIWTLESEINKIGYDEAKRISRGFVRYVEDSDNIYYCPSDLIPLSKIYVSTKKDRFIVRKCERCQKYFYSLKNLNRAKEDLPKKMNIKAVRRISTRLVRSKTIGVTLLLIALPIIVIAAQRRTNLKQYASDPVHTVSAEYFGQGTAYIFYKTDFIGTSQVKYGLDTNYKFLSEEDKLLVQDHKIRVTGLEDGKLYHFVAISKDSAGVSYFSRDSLLETK